MGTLESRWMVLSSRIQQWSVRRMDPALMDTQGSQWMAPQYRVLRWMVQGMKLALMNDQYSLRTSQWLLI
ncbi:unnamed protein product [Nippostrongylus brasiliensis]|uniref:Alternative protein n=1 Tax=Nippostrongylus brasiliensis TaxID=27835 RepID=A0A0N4YNF0_NIPBR|nr:unnamed protein product [Nippostrongylus brasiliensis]